MHASSPINQKQKQKQKSEQKIKQNKSLSKLKQDKGSNKYNKAMSKQNKSMTKQSTGISKQDKGIIKQDKDSNKQVKQKQPIHFQPNNTSKLQVKQNQFHTLSQKFQSKSIPLTIKQLKQRGGLSRQQLQSLLTCTQHVLSNISIYIINKIVNQPNVLKIISPVVIVGDIHGQFFDLINIFELVSYPENTKFLFLGDYVDRGLFCMEVITLLFLFKIKYEKNIYLLRGNHEGKVMTSNFNFRLKKYGIDIYERFLQVFCKLPLSAVVDNSYFAVHGGISPQITKISNTLPHITIEQIQKISRFTQIQNKGIICDLVWSDPSQNTITQWQPNALRGCSYYYGKIQAKKFLKDNQIHMIIRGHQVQMEGFNYQKTNTNDKLTLTIFSAPNYCDSYKNKGAVALISPVIYIQLYINLQNKINIQKYSQVAHPFVLGNYMDLFQFSIPGVSQLVGRLLLYLLRNKNRKSKRENLADDKILQQLDAYRRIQLVQQIMQRWQQYNQEVLLQTTGEQQSQQQSHQQQLLKSYEIAVHFFQQKKVNDCDQMYPSQHTLKMRSRKKLLPSRLNCIKCLDRNQK